VLTDAQSRLLVEERRRKILDLLEAQERVTVSELVRRFGVSAVTVRGDLHALHHAGHLVRSHGGAVRRRESADDIPISIKSRLHHSEKVRIGHRASLLIQDGQTIILDSGTTTMEVARQIRNRELTSLTVITNALNVALQLSKLSHISLIMLGGIMRPASLSMVGPQAERTLQELNADKLFLAVDGLDPETGLTTPDVLEAQLNALMVRISTEVIVVADSSKFMRRSLSSIVGLNRVHRLITDRLPEPPLADALATHDIDVIVA
jgi:DeoR family transcriptional regulator of aga operon